MLGFKLTNTRKYGRDDLERLGGMILMAGFGFANSLNRSMGVRRVCQAESTFDVTDLISQHKYHSTLAHLTT